jgi:hypothetical protein
MVIVAPNLPDQEHLEYVAEEMKRLGVPKIRAIWNESKGVWYAAEGSHRIAAAYRSGIVPIIIDITGQGATVQRNEEDTTMTAEELERWLVPDFGAPKYIFDNNRGGIKSD